MKLAAFTAVLVIASGNAVKGQNNNSRIEFDTLEVFESKILVNYTHYFNSKITEVGQAFLYPTTIKVEKIRWLPWSRKGTVLADSLVLHGTTKRIYNSGKYAVGEYFNGIKVNMDYYDSDGNVIDASQFYGNTRSELNPEQGNNSYTISGTRVN